MAPQCNDSLAEAGLLRCTLHHPLGLEALHPVVYDTGLLLEREKQNLLRMQTARDLMEQINVHTRPQESCFFHRVTTLNKNALCQALHLETRERQKTMQELDEHISHHAHTELREYKHQREYRRKVCNPPVYSWPIPKTHRGRPLNKLSTFPLFVYGTTVSPASGLLE